MNFSSFLIKFFTHPGEALEKGKGKFLKQGLLIVFIPSMAASIALGTFNFEFSPITALLLSLLLVLGSFLINITLYHLIGNLFGKGEKSKKLLWYDFASLYGFSHLPLFIVVAIAAVVFGFGIHQFRNPVAPGIFTVKSFWSVGVLLLFAVSTLVSIIYLALMIKAVYKISWGKIILVILIVSFIKSNVKIEPILPSQNQIYSVSYNSFPLLLEGIDTVDVPTNLTITLYMSSNRSLERNMIVGVQFDQLQVKGLDEEHRVGNSALTKLVALPGDEVELVAGTLFVNGDRLYTPQNPLPHLTLERTVLKEHQYMVYFNSPEALSINGLPEQLIIEGKQINGVPGKSLVNLLLKIMD